LEVVIGPDRRIKEAGLFVEMPSNRAGGQAGGDLTVLM
jgi:hypothetical protein